eukprot:1158899-Pelagomonas_calceolata.AAC.3
MNTTVSQLLKSLRLPRKNSHSGAQVMRMVWSSRAWHAAHVNGAYSSCEWHTAHASSSCAVFRLQAVLSATTIITRTSHHAAGFSTASGNGVLASNTQTHTGLRLKCMVLLNSVPAGSAKGHHHHPHRASHHAASLPNALVAFLEDGIEVVHLFSGAHKSRALKSCACSHWLIKDVTMQVDACECGGCLHVHVAMLYREAPPLQV